MDYRCLYGHRVPDSYKFAIQQRTCPTCGSPTITVSGYRLARRLANEIPLDAITAFNTIYLIEEEHVITKTEASDVEDEEVEAERGEVTLKEEDPKNAANNGKGK